MPCFHPIRGYRSRDVNASGKRSIVFNAQLGFVDLPVDVPCGQCIGCRLERSRQWAIRCVHEASLHEDNCFITLTYDDAHLPGDHSLCKRDFQLFMKRLRKKYSKRIRFFHCGEYGERLSRPHYHACLFGFDFPDKVLFSEKNNNRLFISQSLSDLWGKGFCLIGDVTFESAAYVARYITKKVTGRGASAHYEAVDVVTGEIVSRLPEYVTMSRRPGVGHDWVDKFKSDVYPWDRVILRGRELKPPKFYDRFMEALDPDTFFHIKAVRLLQAKENCADNTPERLAVREKVKLIQSKQLIRRFEDEGSSF